VAVTLAIDGVTRPMRHMSWSVDKQGAQERFEFELTDQEESASSLRVLNGQVIRLLHGTDLLMGGVVFQRDLGRIDGRVGASSIAYVHDWTFLADEVYVPQQTFPAQPVDQLVATLVSELLTDKGVTNITGGGAWPDAPELTVDDDTTTLRTVLDRVSKETKRPWRINGDKQFALVAPGSLPGPVTLSGANAALLPDVKITQQRITRANRVTTTLKAPEAGPGPYEYSESFIGDGVRTIFPVHLLPTDVDGVVTADAVATSTSLDLKGLPASAYLRVGGRLAIEGHTTLYELSAGLTTGSDGTATVGLVVGLEKDVDANTRVTLRRGACVQLEIDGTPTALAGAPWVWEPKDCALVNPSAAPAAGVVVTYRTWAMRPATIRAWSDDAVTAIGGFDRAVLVDGRTDEAEHTDATAGLAFLAQELARRLEEPKVVRLVTRTKGWYPYLTATLDFPDQQLSGLFVVEAVRVSPTGIDPVSTEEDCWYELTLREGLYPGATAIEYQRQRAGLMKGVRWGTPADTMEWTTNRQFTAPAAAASASITPNGSAWADSAWVDVLAAADAASVLTSILVIPGVAAYWEVDIGVGGTPTVIATIGGATDTVADSRPGIYALPIGIDAIPNGSRIAARLRKGGTSTAAWGVAVSYLKKPITGNLTVSAQRQRFAPMVQVASSTSNWGQSNWVQSIASAAADLVLTGIVMAKYSNQTPVEVDIGVGSLGNEVVVYTVRNFPMGSFFGIGGPGYIPFPNPLSGAVAAGDRVSVRYRKSGTAAENLWVGLHYMETPL
jgi:hypothetical protein